VLNESSTKVNVQAMQVMRRVMCHSSNNFASSHTSTKFQKGFLSYNLEHGIISMKKHVACEHGPILLKYVANRNALENTIGKW
jgi:hypothetical protein